MQYSVAEFDEIWNTTMEECGEIYDDEEVHPITPKFKRAGKHDDVKRHIKRRLSYDDAAAATSSPVEEVRSGSFDERVIGSLGW